MTSVLVARDESGAVRFAMPFEMIAFITPHDCYDGEERLELHLTNDHQMSVTVPVGDVSGIIADFSEYWDKRTKESMNGG